MMGDRASLALRLAVDMALSTSIDDIYDVRIHFREFVLMHSMVEPPSNTLKALAQAKAWTRFATVGVTNG